MSLLSEPPAIGQRGDPHISGAKISTTCLFQPSTWEGGKRRSHRHVMVLSRPVLRRARSNKSYRNELISSRERRARFGIRQRAHFTG